MELGRARFAEENQLLFHKTLHHWTATAATRPRAGIALHGFRAGVPITDALSDFVAANSLAVANQHGI